jgi:hypothetical protein
MNLVTRGNQSRHKLPSNRSRGTCHKHSHDQLPCSKSVFTDKDKTAGLAVTSDEQSPGRNAQADRWRGQRLECCRPRGVSQPPLDLTLRATVMRSGCKLRQRSPPWSWSAVVPAHRASTRAPNPSRLHRSCQSRVLRRSSPSPATSRRRLRSPQRTRPRRRDTIQFRPGPRL